MCQLGLELTGTRKGISLKAARVRWVARHKTIASKYRLVSKYRQSVSLRRSSGVANESGIFDKRVDRNFAQPNNRIPREKW